MLSLSRHKWRTRRALDGELQSARRIQDQNGFTKLGRALRRSQHWPSASAPPATFPISSDENGGTTIPALLQSPSLNSLFRSCRCCHQLDAYGYHRAMVVSQHTGRSKSGSRGVTHWRVPRWFLILDPLCAQHWCPVGAHLWPTRKHANCVWARSVENAEAEHFVVRTWTSHYLKHVMRIGPAPLWGSMRVAASPLPSSLLPPLHPFSPGRYQVWPAPTLFGHWPDFVFKFGAGTDGGFRGPVRVGAPKEWGLERWAPKGGKPEFHVFFSPSPATSFLPSLGGLLVKFWWCF